MIKKLSIALLLLGAATAEATVTTSSNTVTYTCSGSTGPYSFTYSAYDSPSLQVSQTIISTGVTTILSTPAQYQISPVNNSYINGGSVTLTLACPTGSSLNILRQTEETQTSHFVQNMPALYATFEAGLDKLTMAVQDTNTSRNLDAILGQLANCLTAGYFYSPAVHGCLVPPGGGGGGGGSPPNPPAFSVQAANSGVTGPTSDSNITINTTTHTLTSQAVTASVNQQINVMAPPYNAKGDCSTDDTSAFTAAQTAAIGFVTGNQVPASLFLPVPPGGCYIVSNMVYQGVMMEAANVAVTGFNGNTNEGFGRVVLKSKPGNDIFHVPDPTSTSGTINLYPGWGFRNISFIVDNSATSSHTHRWPGRWFDDAAMTSGSAVLTTVNGSVTCGDVGQAVQVNGAGSAGGNLVTTILSVTPCSTVVGGNSYTWQTVTLAASASTTVTNAHAYISTLGLSATTNIGSCAFAQDMQDGKPANWVGTINFNVGGLFENDTFSTTTPGNDHACGIYTQGGAILYDAHATNNWFSGDWAGVVQGTTELNSFQQSSSGDFERWDHVRFFLNVTPWISYNGLNNAIRDCQITGNAGMSILMDLNQNNDIAAHWDLECSSFESTHSTSLAYGHHIVGQDMHLYHMSFTGDVAQTGYMDTVESWCKGCYVTGLQIDGSGNKIESQDVVSPNLADYGLDNNVVNTYNPSPPYNRQANYPVSQGIYKGSNNIAGRFTPDAMLDGNTAVVYNHDDLLIFPRDIKTTAANQSWVTIDPTQVTSGGYINMAASRFFSQTSQYMDLTSSNVPSYVIGTNLPQTGATVVYSYRCAGGVTTFTFELLLSDSTNVQQAMTGCTTSPQVSSLSFSWGAGHNTTSLSFGAAGGSNSFQILWLAIVPYVSLNNPTFTGTSTFTSATLPTQATWTYNTGHAPTALAGSAVTASDTTGNWTVSENNGAFYRGCSAGNGACISTVVDTSTPVTVSTTYYDERHFNENATAATAIIYNLPTAAPGKKFCFTNAYNGSAANTGTLELLTSASGQFIIFTDGTLSATGGYVISGGAAADAACVTGVDPTHWMLSTSSGTWTKH